MTVTEPIPDWAARLYGELVIGQIELERKMADLTDVATQASEVLDACERLVADHPEVDVLSAQRRLFRPEDEQEG